MPLEPTDLSIAKFQDVAIRDLIFTPFQRATQRVLVVVDTEIGVFESPNAFGIGRVIRLIRESQVGCTDFDVDVASRDKLQFADNGPSTTNGHVRYTGFRFDGTLKEKRVLDSYHVIAIFGFKPGNDGSPDDQRIDDSSIPGVVPMSDGERDALSAWMDAGGGVFATGDHHYLGATICHRIPRVRSMRRWTNADGVPPIGGPSRVDTHQPVTPDQWSGAAMISGSAQSDTIPQPINWVAVTSYQQGFWRVRRPHPVLCHPTHGPIDVMPDHAHEGLCVEPTAISGDRVHEFPGGTLPQVIAYGQVLADPPLQHSKGDVNAQRFPMISVYDGWSQAVGRIVVDSTWHHWMDLNVHQIEQAGGQTWEKIARYFVNVMTWVAPPGVYKARCWWELFGAHFDGHLIEETSRDATALNMGSSLYEFLSSRHGPCTVREFVFISICELRPKLCEGLMTRFKLPESPVCLTCPPFDLIERVVLGGMILGTMDLAEKVRHLVEGGEAFELNIEEVSSAALAGADQALAEFSEQVLKSTRDVQELFS